MSVSPALQIAISLRLMPTQSHLIKKAPLPDGITDLLHIAAGDEDVVTQATKATERSEDFIKKAAIFFIEHVLLAHDADSYRVLGSDPTSTSRELRRNMALITRFLHPDLDKGGDRAIFITRVTGAWNDLKTPEKRAAYDRQRAAPPREQVKRRPSRPTSRRKYNSGSLHPKNNIIPAQPQYKVRRIRGAIMRQLTLFLMKISGR